MAANLQTRFEVNGRVVVRRIGEDLLLVPVSGPAAGASVYPVNRTALAIWECLSAGGTIAEAAERLVREFGAAPEEAQADCTACAQALVAESLLRELLA